MIRHPWRELGNTRSVAIGDGSLIREGVLSEALASCSVVSRDVPANSLVVGNPAGVQRVRRDDGGWDRVADGDEPAR